MLKPSLEELRREADQLDLARFDYAVAWDLGLRLRDRAVEQALPVGIEVFHGTAPVFLSLLPGSSPDNVDWLRRKRAVALRFHQSSLAMRRLCEEKGVEFAARYHLPSSEFVASGGAVPITVRGSGVVGVATVSGLPDTEDHALVVSALRELRRAQGVGD